MHCNSKLSRVDENIYFLERKLFDHSQYIDGLATSFEKLKLSPNKNIKPNEEENITENHIKQTTGIL